MTKISVARFTEDEQVCRIAKLSPFTRDFASHRFYRDKIEQTYAAGEVGVARRGAKIVGFVYCKHLKRKPMSVIHFMGVAPEARGTGVGRALLDWALSQSPHKYVELSCEHANNDGLQFYDSCGWTRLSIGTYGTVPRLRPYTRFGKHSHE